MTDEPGLFDLPAAPVRHVPTAYETAAGRRRCDRCGARGEPSPCAACRSEVTREGAARAREAVVAAVGLT